MNTFRVRTADMPSKCIIKIGPERVKFKNHGNVQISWHSDKLFRNWEVHKNDKATAIPLKIKHLTPRCTHTHTQYKIKIYSELHITHSNNVPYFTACSVRSVSEWHVEDCA